MSIEIDDRAINLIGRGIRHLNFLDDDRSPLASIFVDQQGQLNIGNLQINVAGGNGGDSGGGGALPIANAPFLTLHNTGLLTNERKLTNAGGLTFTDTGAQLRVGLGLPGTLTAQGLNGVTAASHTHTVSASSVPGPNEVLLKSAPDGSLTLMRLDVDNVRLDGNAVSATVGDLTLSAAGGDVVLAPAVNIGSSAYVSQLQGWRVTNAGQADFRYLYADELHVKAFIADIEQALAGGQIISKSVAILSRDFTVPYEGAIQAAVAGAGGGTGYFAVSGDQTAIIPNGSFVRVAGSAANDGTYQVHSTAYVAPNTRIFPAVAVPANSGASGRVRGVGTLYVEDLPGFENVQVFTANDWIRLRVIDRSGGGLVVANVWGRVTTYVDLPGGEQQWTFTCHDRGGVGGSIVHTGAIALDYGQSGDGYWEVTTLDNSGPTPGPYAQIVTWATDPTSPANYTLQTRLGYLGGITDSAFPTIGGYGLYSTNVFLKGRIEAEGSITAGGGLVTLNALGLTIRVPPDSVAIPAQQIDWVNNSNSNLIAFVRGDLDSNTSSLQLHALQPSGGSAAAELFAVTTSNARTGVYSIPGTVQLWRNDTVVAQGTSAGFGTPLNVDLFSGGDLSVSGDIDAATIEANRVQINSANAVLQLTNSETGSGQLDGTLIYVPSGGVHSRIANFENGRISLATNGTDRWHVYSTGGLAAEGLPADTNGQISARRLYIEGNNPGGFAAHFFNDGNNTNRWGLLIQAGEDANPTARFINFSDGDGTTIGYVIGNGSGGVNYSTTSDRRLKADLQPIGSLLERIGDLRAVTYRARGYPGARRSAGLIADDVQQLVPELVQIDENGLLTLDYGRTAAVIATRGLQEVVERLAGIEQRLAALETA